MPKLIPNAVWGAQQMEVAWLRSRVADLLRQLEAKHDHERRIERIASGVPELPARPPERLDPMPSVLREVIDEYPQGSPIRDDLRKAWTDMRKKLGDWDSVVREVGRQMDLVRQSSGSELLEDDAPMNAS